MKMMLSNHIIRTSITNWVSKNLARPEIKILYTNPLYSFSLKDKKY